MPPERRGGARLNQRLPQSRFPKQVRRPEAEEAEAVEEAEEAECHNLLC